MSATGTPVEIEGRRLVLGNLDKVLYPEAGFTKGQVIDYYARVAPVLLPHLRDRPLTMKRYPDGVDHPFFYEKRCPRWRPEWVRTAPYWSGRRGEHILTCLISDLPTLIWAANLADLELHTLLARTPELDHPDLLVFDLDPGPPAALLECCRVALLVRSLLDELSLKGVPKTSGGKGLQLYVPLDRTASYDETEPFAHAVALRLERQEPELVVSRMSKALRVGKVLVDWSQNVRSKTTVSVYSLRAGPTPTVSTPLAWAEVERAVRQRDASGLVFGPAEVLQRVEAHGDLFERALAGDQRLPGFDGELPARSGRRRARSE